MKLPIGFIGKVEAKVIKLYSEPYNIHEAMERINNKKSTVYNAIVSDNISFGGWEYTYLSNDIFSLRVVYEESTELYESLDPKLNDVYLIKIIKIIK
jgi:hypothetical protein